MKISEVSCGETSEIVAAATHGVVAVLYLTMLVWHVLSVFKHFNRRQNE